MNVFVELSYRQAELVALAIEGRLTDDGQPKSEEDGRELRRALLLIRDGQADTSVGRDRAKGGIF